MAKSIDVLWGKLKGLTIGDETLRYIIGRAVQNRDIDALKETVRRGAPVTNALLFMPASEFISVQAVSQTEEVFRYLAKHGANINFNHPHRDGATPLQDAIIRGDEHVVKALCAVGANLSITNIDGDTALHVAAKYGRSEMVEELSRNNPYKDVKNTDGDTPLIVAFRHKHSKVIRKLLEHGADPNAQDIVGDTLLHFVARDGDMEVTESLLEDVHIDANKKGYKGKTPLMLTYSIAYPSIAEKLIDAGAMVDAVDPEYGINIFGAAMIDGAEKKKDNARLLDVLFERGGKFRDEDLVHIASKPESFAMMVRFDPLAALLGRFRHYCKNLPIDRSRYPNDTKLGASIVALYKCVKQSHKHFDAFCQIMAALEPHFLLHVAEQMEPQRLVAKRVDHVMGIALWETVTAYNKHLSELPYFRERFPQCTDQNIITDVQHLVEELKAASYQRQFFRDISAVSNGTSTMIDIEMNRLTYSVRTSMYTESELRYQEIPVWEKNGDRLQLRCTSGKQAMVLKESLNSVLGNRYQNTGGDFRLGQDDAYLVTIECSKAKQLVDKINKSDIPDGEKSYLAQKLGDTFSKKSQSRIVSVSI